MTDYLSTVNPIKGKQSRSYDSFFDIAMCKSAGVDVIVWAQAKAVVTMAGPVAEAIYCRRDVLDVVQSHECQSDVSILYRDCSLAGMAEEDVARCLCRAVDIAASFLSRENVWSAVKALAAKLPSVGKMKGKEAAKIIDAALAGTRVQITKTDLLRSVRSAD
jgi:hypothetical protein